MTVTLTRVMNRYYIKLNTQLRYGKQRFYHAEVITGQ